MASCAVDMLSSPRNVTLRILAQHAAEFLLLILSSACVRWLRQALTLAFTLTVTVKRENTQPHTASPPTTTKTTLTLPNHSISLTHITVSSRAASSRMATPLIDIDANPRQPGFKSTKIGSKIPSPPKFQRTGSAGRRAPFSVSTTGSPCYVATPTDAKAVVSPTPTSRLPRKSTPTQSAFSKSYTYGSRPATPHANLPRSRNWQKRAAIAVPSSSVCSPIKHRTTTTNLWQTSIRTTPPLSCDKTLPSPPIAQIVNPASPPKAQRTLVDAEAGTPTEEVWPVLQPENVRPSSSPALSTDGKTPQRSPSEDTALRSNDIAALKNRDVTPSLSNSTPSQMSEWSHEEEQSDPLRPRVMIEPRMFSPMNPYAKSFHAFSTNSKVPMDSLLAYKQQTLPAKAIPPRISSKRDSLPLPDTAVDESPTQPSASLRPGKSGCTRWPDLAAAEEATEIQVDNRACGSDQRLSTEPDSHEPVSFDGADVIQSHFGSIDSVSTWSLAAGSSLNDDAEVNYEGSVRVKRLSWHSSNPGTGPTLRISADADAVLLGRDESIPAVPAVPEHMLRKPSYERSSDILSGRVSKQVLVNTNVCSGSRTPSPSFTETEAIGSKPVKITPIRSMQPPRKSSAGDLFKRSPSLSVPASTEAAKVPEILESSQPHPHGSIDASQDPLSLHVDRSLTTFTVDPLTTKPDSSTGSVVSGEFSKYAYVGRLQNLHCFKANRSRREPGTTPQRCWTEFHRKLSKCWVQRQIPHNPQPAKACR